MSFDAAGLGLHGFHGLVNEHGAGRQGAGQRIVVDWTRANRDPRVFMDPDAFNPEENAPNNLVYGRGPHVCPGRGLATLELRILLEELLPVFSSIDLPVTPRGVRAEFPLGGWAACPVVFH